MSETEVKIRGACCAFESETGHVLPPGLCDALVEIGLVIGCVPSPGDISFAQMLWHAARENPVVARVRRGIPA